MSYSGALQNYLNVKAMSCKIEVVAIEKKENYTLSQMFINDKYFCDVIEDAIRDEKIYGITAIPRGTYKVIINKSIRFKKLMPLLLDVPNFEGVRIHSGNSEKDSLACLIVGQQGYLLGKRAVLNSRATFDKLMKRLKDEKDITITLVA